MDIVIPAAQLIIALSLLNVWLIRRERPTGWRGGDARNMREEFAVYGLPGWFVPLIGVLKISFALLLLAGIWVPGVTKVAAIGIAALMLGAVAMHFKVRDPLRKSLPAFMLFAVSLTVAAG